MDGISMNIEQPAVLDILDTTGTPALSSTSDMPVVETKPDAQNEGRPPSLEQPAAAETPEQPGESATSATDEAPAEPAKKESRGVQKALDRLTSEREEQRRRADAAEERLDRALAALEKTTGKPAVEAKQDTDEANPVPVKPDKAEFSDPDAYEVALETYYDQRAQWTVKKELQAKQAEQEQEVQRQAIEDQQRTLAEAHSKRIEAAKAKYPDFDESIKDVAVPQLAAIAIQHAEQGAEMMRYYGEHRDEAKKLFQLSPPLMIMELGRIAERLSQPAKPNVSNAPPPIPARRPSAEPDRKPLEDMSMEEYAVYAKERDRQARRH